MADNRDGFIAAVTTFAFAMGLFLLFAAGVWSWLKGRPGAPDALTAAFAFGSVSFITMCFAGFAPTLALAYRAPEVAAARELWDLSFGLLALSGIPTAIALGAFAALVLPARSWLAAAGWIAVVAAVAHVVVALSFIPTDGFFSLEGGVIVAIPATMFLWLLVTSVALLKVGNREAPGAP